jgi:hypothetical protein
MHGGVIWRFSIKKWIIFLRSIAVPKETASRHGNTQKEDNWLGGRDSNPDTQLQRLQSYPWTTSQFKAGQHIPQHPGTTAPQNGLFFNIPAEN